MTNTPGGRLQGIGNSTERRTQKRTRQGLWQDARGAYIGKHMTMREIEKLLANVTRAERQGEPEGEPEGARAGAHSAFFKKGWGCTWKNNPHNP